MKVFSKRYSARDFIRIRRYAPVGIATQRPEFLESSLRIRLSQEISYIVESGSFTEPFLLSRFQGEDKYFFNNSSLQRLSYHELGYDITDYYSCDELIPIRVKAEDRRVYQDKYLLDLVELLIIFALNDKREEIIKRFAKILQEENSDLLIYGHMIVIQDAGGLQSVTTLLTDTTLREKLEDILVKRVETTIAARESAEITQRIFSGTEKGKTKQHSEDIVEKISQRWVSQKDQENFKNLISNLIKDVKAINNEISNIRHTDRSTIDFGSPDVFKMIRNLNLAVSEMAILSTQDDFIENESAIELKNQYLESYNIDNRSIEVEKPVSLQDIPF